MTEPLNQPYDWPPDTEWHSPGYELPPELMKLGAEAEALTAAADAAHDGAMIALVPSQADLDRLAIDGGEPADELHLTLFYLGDAVDYDAAQQAAVVAAVEDRFSGFGSVGGVAFGVNYWNPGGEQPAWVLAVGDSPDEPGLLHDARETAEQALTKAGVDQVPPQHTPWVPHICLAYETAGAPEPDYLAQLASRVGPVSFDRARVAFGNTVTDVPLGGG